ncbi:FxSxx-COOH system tetratricopeptide repeat protein [Streptomyces sp. NPDC046909]|uniref:FxSxx-COOH system tetratricopeptide repeat protein n=1 Tax=Streptomyces sp. NPDC046909 TaxID=3155617 RepID=UPI0033C3B7F3
MTAPPDGRIITFYSYKGGTGRTMALANVAWILAANGKRVLAVDWDLEAPGLHRYFHPFLEPSAVGTRTGVLDMVTDYAWAATTGDKDVVRSADWHRTYASVLPHALPLDVGTIGMRFPEGGSLDLLSAGRQNREYSATVAALNWDNFYERLGGGLFLDALREDMKASYDYVLIDSRPGLTDTADICTVHLPDVLVNCFTLNSQSIEGAASVARSITAFNQNREDSRRIRILPVPMRIDLVEMERIEFGRELARQQFEGLPTAPDGSRLSPQEQTVYWYNVEIAYHPYYAYEEMLATFGDTSGVSNSLLASYERLTTAITDGETTSMPPLPKQIRLRGKDRFLRPRPVPQHHVAVVYAPESLMWAEWVEITLVAAGCRVSRHDVSTGPVSRPEETTHTAVLLSRAAHNSRYTDAFRSTLALDPASHGPVLALRVDEVRLSSYGDDAPVDLHRLTETQCTAALLRAFGILRLPGYQPPVGVRFPGSTPRLSNVPPRNSSFTGRDELLTALRGELSGGSGVSGTAVQALHGFGGVGKTQLALEYVYRFMADYDVVWWIPAQRPDTITAALAELGDKLGLPGGEDMARAARETVRCLAHENRDAGRWLLVFDGADTPAGVSDHFPSGGGHILVTARNRDWSQHALSLPVGVLPREDSVELLRHRVPGLNAEDADKVATAVGDLPLALEHAAAWLAATGTPVDDYLEELTAHITEDAGLGAVTAAWNLSLASLRESSPAAARLLELCAFFSPEPISVQLVYSPEMFEALKPYDPSLVEPLLMGRLLRDIGRLSLALIDPSINSVQLHRLLQEAIRAQLDEERQQEARRTVHTVLAAVRPDEDEPVDDPRNWPRFEIIWPHLKAAGVRDAETPEARRLLIDRVRYLEKRGDLPRARQLAEDLLEHWGPLLGEDNPQYLYLRGRLADVLRAQGQFTEARRIDEELLASQREALGETHPHTYMTMSGLARDLTALGSYETALDLARAAHEGLTDIFFAFHPRTLDAASELALALRTLGRHEEARALDEETLSRRTEVLGPEHPATLASAEALGHDLREVGRYEESVDLLRRTYDTYGRALGEDFPGTLRCGRSLAASLRRRGDREEALRLTEATVARYQTLYESPTPDSLACELSLMAVLSTTKQRERALEVGKQTLAKYERAVGEHHPHTYVARHNVGVLLRVRGEAVQAEPVFAQVRTQLLESLGERHPHTLFCAVNHANALVDLDRLDEAEALERRATQGLREVLGPMHPEYLEALANLSLTLTALGREEEGARLREEALDVLAMLGSEAQLTRVRRKGRVSRYLDQLAI